MKFAEYVDLILIYKLWKFGEYICYNSRDVEFFLEDYFFGVPCSHLMYANYSKYVVA